eukprot:248615_1
MEPIDHKTLDKICQDHNNKDGDVSDDVCYQCGKRGELVCCDGCPHAFHLVCVGLSAVPDDKWFCGECVNNKNTSSGNRMEETEDIVMEDMNNEGEVKSKGSGIFSAIFMANKGDGRIGDWLSLIMHCILRVMWSWKNKWIQKLS